MKIELNTDEIFKGVQFEIELDIKAGPRFRLALALIHLASWVLRSKITIK